MSIIPKKNLIGYWPLDGYAYDRSERRGELYYSHFLGDSRLVAYYRLEDTSDSKGSYTLDAGTYTSATSKFNNGHNTLGASRYVQRTTNLGINGNGAITLSFWYKGNTEITSSVKTFIEYKSSTSDGRFALFYNYNAGTPRVEIDSNGTRTVYAISLGTTNIYHILATRDSSGNTNLIINGASVATGTSGTSTYSLNFLTIGALSTGGNPIDGIFDDVAVFNTNISVGEASEIYNFGVNGNMGGNHGTVTGAIPVPSQNPAIPASLAYKFVESTKDVIKMPSFVRPTTSALTIGCWVKTNQTNGISGVMIGAKDDGVGSAQESFKLYHNGNANVTIGFRIETSGGFKTLSSNAGIRDKWSFVTGVYDGAFTYLYINGKYDNISTSITGTLNTGTGLAIGNTSDENISASYAFDGRIQDAFIFNTALSPQTIKQIYNQSKWKYSNKNLFSQIAQAISNFFLFFN